MGVEPRYEQTEGGWIGRVGDRRTMIKGTWALAEQDVKNQRFVCQDWPDCPHRDADACRWASRRQSR